MNRHRNRFWTGPAFTLIELLVVIGIIGVLIGLLFPAIGHIRREASRNRTKGDLQSISMALEQYKADFGDYPRTDPNQPNTGAAVLGKALLGTFGDGLLPGSANPDPSDPPTYTDNTKQAYSPGDCFQYSGSYYVTLVPVPQYQGVPTDNTIYAAFNPLDNQDGPGFKARPGAGRTYGPYISPDKIAWRGTDILDHDGAPILYFPARPGQRNLSPSLVPAEGTRPYVDESALSQYNAKDNLEIFARRDAATGKRMTAELTDDIPAKQRMRTLLGDANGDGVIQAGETPVSMSYLLWSAGPDGVFGPGGTNSPPSASDVANCDDVTNFR